MVFFCCLTSQPLDAGPRQSLIAFNAPRFCSCVCTSRFSLCCFSLRRFFFWSADRPFRFFCEETEEVESIFLLTRREEAVKKLHNMSFFSASDDWLQGCFAVYDTSGDGVLDQSALELQSNLNCSN